MHSGDEGEVDTVGSSTSGWLGAFTEMVKLHELVRESVAGGEVKIYGLVEESGDSSGMGKTSARRDTVKGVSQWGHFTVNICNF